MKKLVTVVMALVLVLAMAGIASAKDLAVTGTETGNSVDAIETQIDMTKADAKITLVVAQTDAEKYGWGLGNFGANVNGTWTDSTIASAGEIQCADDQNATFTYTVKELIESFGVTDASALADIKFGTWNGGMVVSCSFDDGAAADTGDAGDAGDDAPKTADAMNIVLVAGLAVVALAGAMVVANKKNA